MDEDLTPFPPPGRHSGQNVHDSQTPFHIHISSANHADLFGLLCLREMQLS